MKCIYTTIFTVAEDWSILNPKRQKYFEQYKSPFLKQHYSVAKLGYVKEEPRTDFYDLCASNKPNSAKQRSRSFVTEKAFKHLKISKHNNIPSEYNNRAYFIKIDLHKFLVFIVTKFVTLKQE